MQTTSEKKITLVLSEREQFYLNEICEVFINESKEKDNVYCVFANHMMQALKEHNSNL